MALPGIAHCSPEYSAEIRYRTFIWLIAWHSRRLSQKWNLIGLPPHMFSVQVHFCNLKIEFLNLEIHKVNLVVEKQNPKVRNCILNMNCVLRGWKMQSWDFNFRGQDFEGLNSGLTWIGYYFKWLCFQIYFLDSKWSNSCQCSYYNNWSFRKSCSNYISGWKPILWSIP